MRPSREETARFLGFTETSMGIPVAPVRLGIAPALRRHLAAARRRRKLGAERTNRIRAIDREMLALAMERAALIGEELLVERARELGAL